MTKEGGSEAVLPREPGVQEKLQVQEGATCLKPTVVSFEKEDSR